MGSAIRVQCSEQIIVNSGLGIIGEFVFDDPNGRNELGTLFVLVFGRYLNLFWI